MGSQMSGLIWKYHLTMYFKTVYLTFPEQILNRRMVGKCIFVDETNLELCIPKENNLFSFLRWKG